MAPPPQQKCSQTDCQFETPAGCPTWELLSTFLVQHTQAVHAAAPANSPSVPRLEKLPRPTFTLDMSQAEWSFTEAQWTAYISQQAGLREEVKVQQLQAACDQALLRRVYDDGGLAALDTEAKLLAKVKKLAVRVVHKTLHMQNLWNMIQQAEEPIRAFASRLTGTAELCDFTMTCSSDTCNHKNSYKDQMIMQALLKGMSDTDIRTRVLSRTQNNELLTLHAIIDYIAAEEASFASFASLQHPHTVAANKSSYIKLKRDRQLEETPPANTKCTHCGGRHPGDNSPPSRRIHCKAYGKKCSNCDKPHHFPGVCKSRKKITSAAGTVTTQADQTITGSITDPSAALFHAMATPPSNKADNCTPSHPREVDNGVSRTSGGGQGTVCGQVATLSALLDRGLAQL